MSEEKRGLPVVIWDSAQIGPDTKTAHFSFAGHPGTTEHTLFEFGEHQIVERVAFFDFASAFVVETLGLESNSAWCLINEQRHAILPDGPDGKPGDFDLIVGPIRDGLVHFDCLAEAEIKIRKVDVNGKPRSFASGQGTTQAQGAAELGFDRTLLLHVLVQDSSGDIGGAAWWRATAGRSDFHETVRRTIGQVRNHLDLDSAPFGYGLLGWGHASTVEPTITGAIVPVRQRDPPLRPLHDRHAVRRNRDRIESGLRRRLGERRPAARVFRACCRCGQVFATGKVAHDKCQTCTG